MRTQLLRGRRRSVLCLSLCGVTLPAVLLAVVGCGAEEMEKTSQATYTSAPAASPPMSAAPTPPVAEEIARIGASLKNIASGAALPPSRISLEGMDKGGPPDAPGTGTAVVPASVVRKIVYNARITLVVENVVKLGEKVAKLVKESGGYISQSDESSYTSTQRQASWTVRVPVEKFDSFMASVGKMGELEQNHIDTQDVTQEYYDVEARIANKQQEEKRLQKHLDDSTGKLEDILAVERELTRVRGEIEQMQGRIRYLANVSAMCTVTISGSEVRNYKPPIRPTFATQISRTFQGSIDHLIGFGKAIVLFAVAVIPWLPLVLIAAIPFLWAVRRAFRALPA